jgi:sugar phosphate isomerase/epimerase
MNLKLGMPTLIEHQTLKESVQLCHELGLNFVELNMNLPQYQVEQLEAFEELHNLAREYGISYTIHLDENLNVSDFNPMVSEAYMETVRRTIAVAKELSIPLINMHMNDGVYFTLPDRKVYLFELYKDTFLQSILKLRQMCESEIGDHGIVISIENTDGYRTYQEEAIEILLESKVFSLTFDIGHSHSHKDIDEPFILQHEDRLRHFHIHDAVKDKNHLTLGSGEIDLKQRLMLAKKLECSCVLETKTIQALKESVVWLQQLSLSGRK